MERVHILHLIDSLDYGGAQKLLVALAKYTPMDRYRVSVCTLQPKTDLKSEIEAHGVQTVCLDRSRPSVLCPHKLVGYALRNVRDVAKFCRQEKVQVIQCHLSDAEFIGIAAGILCGIRRIIPMNHYPFMPSGRGALDLRNLLRRLSCRIMYNVLCYCVIAVSQDTAERLVTYYGVDPGKIRVVVNGIDVEINRLTLAQGGLRQVFNITPDHRVVLAVGRLTRQKGHIYLIEAVARLLEEFPKLKVLIAGEGELKEQLVSRCEELHLQSNILFLGNRRDVSALLAISELFVMPSLWEGTSLALLEAMASAKPVLATDAPGNSNIIRHLENGYLVPAGSSERLSEGISFLLNHLAESFQLGQRAWETVRKGYDARRMVAEMEPLWLGRDAFGRKPGDSGNVSF